MAHTTQRPEIASHDVAEQRAKVELERLIARRQQEFKAAQSARQPKGDILRFVRSIGESTRHSLRRTAKG